MLPHSDWAAKWALYQPDKTAFQSHESQRSLTYQELHDQSVALACWLRDEWGLQKGDRLAVLAELDLEYVLLFAAAQKGGFILVPLNYRLARAELDYLLSDSEPAAICFEEKYQDLIAAAPNFTQHEHTMELGELVVESQRQAVEAWGKWDNVPVSDGNPIFILYTSGTTGRPKGAIYTHGMLFWNSINTELSLALTPNSRTINCMPPFHTGGWNVLLNPVFHHGGFNYLMKRFDAATVLELLESQCPTIFMAVPTMLKMIADQPGFADADLSSLDYLIVGGEPMPIPLIETYHAKGIAVRQGYGMTEVGPNLTSLHQKDAIRKKGSIGFPNFYIDIRIVNEQGDDVPANESGELLLRSPVVTPGYWRNPEATAKAKVGEWFRTGDQVRRDEEGYLFIVDRIKNMFISGGENVYPAEIERVLVSYPAIEEAAVIGIPHPKWGEVGCAFVVCGSTPLDEATVKAHCEAHLARFKVPKQVVFLDALPKGDTGKIDRKRLKEKSALKTGF